MPENYLSVLDTTQGELSDIIFAVFIFWVEKVLGK